MLVDSITDEISLRNILPKDFSAFVLMKSASRFHLEDLRVSVNLCFITSNNSFNNRFSDCLKENYKEMANFLGSTVSTTVEALMKESPIEELKVMTNRFIGLVSLKSQQNIFSTYKYDFITLSCMTVAAIISLILTFSLATTSAVILVSVCASIALFVQSVHYAIIILCMTVAIFILAALSGFFTKNVTVEGFLIFISIAAGLVVIGLIVFSLEFLLPQLMIVVGVCWSLAMFIVIFITIKLRELYLDKTLASALFMAYALWLQKTIEPTTAATSVLSSHYIDFHINKHNSN
ncbi:unnamed protein product [Heterobilharzia americana]|nr:unnamed protein product [Heterobilharzia americana]